MAQNKLEFYTYVLAGYSHDPEKAAYQLFSNVVHRDAFVIAINNVFVIISLIFFVSMLILPFASNVKDQEGHAH